jgi:hypothetical protein
MNTNRQWRSRLAGLLAACIALTVTAGGAVAAAAWGGEADG